MCVYVSRREGEPGRGEVGGRPRHHRSLEDVLQGAARAALHLQVLPRLHQRHQYEFVFPNTKKEGGTSNFKKNPNISVSLSKEVDFEMTPVVFPLACVVQKCRSTNRESSPSETWSSSCPEPTTTPCRFSSNT